MDELGDCHTEWSKSDRERETLYDSLYMWNIKRNDTNEFTCKAETDSWTSRMSSWVLVGKDRGKGDGWAGRTLLWNQTTESFLLLSCLVKLESIQMVTCFKDNHFIRCMPRKQIP